jgi:deoxyhypusine monooxygenase
LSVDPAPADRSELSLEQLQDQLLDQSLPLFKRYRAMFSLRNMGSAEAVAVLAEGFRDSSPLFRHEVR